LYEKPEIPFLESLKYFDWVIVGGESGNETGQYRYRPCNLEWIESIIDNCGEFGVPVFVKQLGTHLSKEMGLKDRHGGDISEWPKYIQIRQFTADLRYPF
jgi:protein gp37